MPKEKRRFFTPSPSKDSVADSKATCEAETLFVEDSESPNQSQEEEVESTNDKSSTNPDNFASFKDVFVSILGSIPEKVVQRLYKKYNSSSKCVELAINDFLENQERSTKDEKTIQQKDVKLFSRPAITPRASESSSVSVPSENADSGFWIKYLGSLHAQAWATRPIARPLSPRERIDIRCLTSSKIRPSSSREKSKSSPSSVVRLFTASANDEKGREVGRLPEDISRILSPLIEDNTIVVKAFVTFSDGRRLSIGDSFHLRIDIYLSEAAFVKDLGHIEQADSFITKRRKFNHEEPQHIGEDSLRSRQQAISRLFKRLRLSPEGSMLFETSVIDVPDENRIENTDISEVTNHFSEDKLDVDQLQQIYHINHLFQVLEQLPTNIAPPEENCKIQLRPYQKTGLSWMLSREMEFKEMETLSNINCEESVSSSQIKSNIPGLKENALHPLWSKFRWPEDKSLERPNETCRFNDTNHEFFYANIFNGELSLKPPLAKTSLKGGILADEMGLGKTISTLSLVHSVPCDVDYANSQHNDTSYAYGTTLVILPMSLLSQWENEFSNTNNNPHHECLVYYGEHAQNLRTLLTRPKANKVPVVLLTTYGTVLNEFMKYSKNFNSYSSTSKQGLYSVRFFRIILDEGHIIRNRLAKTSKAVYALSSDRKWVLTGTPIINRLDDLFSIFKFLELEPWNNFTYWKNFVSIPFEQRHISQALHIVKTILEPIFLRRTKDMKQPDGKKLITLPEKQIITEEIAFSEHERDLYSNFKNKASQLFNESVNKGDVFKSYIQIFTYILRLRQICCHTDLLRGVNEDDLEVNTFAEDISVSEDIADDGIEGKLLKRHLDSDGLNLNEISCKIVDALDLKNLECSICTSYPIPLKQVLFTPCQHAFCFTCILDHVDFQTKLNQSPLCPNCRKPISKYCLLKPDLAHSQYSSNLKLSTWSSKPRIHWYNPSNLSSKLYVLCKHLKRLEELECNENVVVFSSFSSFLDIIFKQLNDHFGDDVEVLKFDGRLKANERSAVLDRFNTSKKNRGFSVLLLSLKAGGIGLNLTTASVAFLMDPWWSPSVEDQAIDRLHRIGQDKSVKVVRFIVSDSIEKKILKIQLRKKQIGEAVGVEEEERKKRKIEELQLLFEE
ncbi:Piso0_000876 [Millerozyma farinosa CBS 7064]|uniref:DNA repair protein RAD5 n=1 Tax=Pichia sorbitophila (strain ATCC MYA-4447 / BCRC 22081 / CBS 7064 / NBRC 10061 / NRRL Y-12695) TaxID=559304 RepID=G8YQA9_PICSO|nr:Piso0_000876 [Millerozyma farinosa CBS 7064]